MQYRVYFEICGKKMQLVIEAESAKEATAELKKRIIIHKISRENDDLNTDSLDFLKNIFGFK
jgi:hypothetical protein